MIHPQFSLNVANRKLTMVNKPLSNIKILELSTMIAGPFAGQQLGDLGADVIKIERPGQGELARTLEPRMGDGNGESFYFHTANRNKRSIALDVTEGQGRDIFLNLLEDMDVVLENFHPSFTEKYDLDYESVKKYNDSIIYCSISAFGTTGPYREHPGIDTTVQALSGGMSMTRGEDTPPMRTGVPMNDVFASLYAVQGILAALRRRDLDGSGELIDISLLDAGIAGLTTRAMYSLISGEPYPPFGRRHNYFAPEGVYEVANGYVQLSVVTDRHWEWFCDVLDVPDLASDERFEGVNNRANNVEELDEELAAHMSDWTVDQLVNELRDANIPVAPINDTRSVWKDPQVQSRDMLQHIQHPEDGEVPTIGFPVKYDEIAQSIDRHPPLLGEHTTEILSEVGYEDHQIDELRSSDIVEQA